MNIISLSCGNIEHEHICCSLSDKKGDSGVKSKKEWLKERFSEGLVFKKADVKGKVFIEYIPAEKAWCPLSTEGYTFINCLWVSGQYKGKGLGGRLLDECIKDSKGKNGIIVVSSKQKKPYLADKKFFLYKGFEVCDTAPPYYELLCLKFDKNAANPRFKECTKSLEIPQKEGVAIYYSHQCPFCENYIGKIEKAVKEENIPITTRKYETAEEAQKAPCVSTTFSVFYKGKFVTHEILTSDKFKKLFL